jgi:GrpB protein
MSKSRVVLVPHDPRWAQAFEEGRAAIIVACGKYVLDVVHVGSTAIPGIVAKPVIDMMAFLRRHEDGFALCPCDGGLRRTTQRRTIWFEGCGACWIGRAPMMWRSAAASYRLRKDGRSSERH